MSCLDPNPAARVPPLAPAPIAKVNIILPEGTPRFTAQTLIDLFSAANERLNAANFEVSVHTLTDCPATDPQYWQRRLAVFLGDMHNRWGPARRDSPRAWQILHHAPDAILIGGAAFLLAGSGIDARHPVAIHPNFTLAAAADGLTPTEGTRHLSSGPRLHSAISTLATLPLLIDLIGRDHGDYLASALAAYLGLEPGTERPRGPEALELRRRCGGERVVSATLDLMETQLEDPHSIAEMVRWQNVSPRQLQRRFMKVLGDTPLSIYRRLRVEKARQLITQTSLPLPEVAIVTGFGATAHLTRCFKTVYDTTPSTLRRAAFRTEAPQAA